MSSYLFTGTSIKHLQNNFKTLKKSYLSFKTVTIVIILFFCLTNASAQKPNIVFILADDLGYGDLECYGNPYVETPNINQLADEGIKLTRYYSPSPLCAPARAGILTGRYNHRTGAIDVSSNRGIDRIALSEKTMGDYFQYAGYKTALIGKWHNGLYDEAYLPYNRGFDLFFGYPNGGQDYYHWNLMRNGNYVKNNGEYLTDALTDEAITFVDQNKNNPFFLFLAHPVPHPPLEAPDSLIQKYIRKLNGAHSKETAIVYAMIESMDKAVGRLINKLEELGIRDNTIIIFTSDNGAYYFDKQRPRYHGPFAGEKGNVLEQGIRVPAIISWQNTLSANKIISTPLFGCDWLPTLYSLTGENDPPKTKKLDGLNVMPLIRGDEHSGEWDNRDFFFQKNRYTPVGHSDGAMIKGKWKLYWPGETASMKKQNVRDGISYIKGITDKTWEMPLDPEIPAYETISTSPPQLFNMVRDPSEFQNLANEYPRLVNEMTKEYDDWFNMVFSDWAASWDEIKKHDKVYWQKKKIPDPNQIYNGFWPWDKVAQDSTNANPLEVFEGYW